MHERTGLQAEPRDLIDLDRLLRSFSEVTSDPSDPSQLVVFGTSGHCDTSLNGSSNEAHIAALSATDVADAEPAGDQITAVLASAPHNGAPVGGRKVQAEHAWFAGRPSGTEDVMKIHAESFRSEVRGRGAMLAIEFAKPRIVEPAPDAAKQVAAYANARGVLTLTAGAYGNVVGLPLPLVIAEDLPADGIDVLTSRIEALQ
ncbi:hypothetical protein ACFWN7_08945 [Agromyces sp. NPDC058484]|uniref:hypothetical protein n=1 Tax=Agromyces sp. NPDC058484 TaxID=3346524 RepID=UPI0036461492